MTYETLQIYWWMVIALLGSLLVFMMFVQGGQTLFKQIGKNELERSLLVNSIGRKWDITFTVLVTFGGAAFASFPMFYATSFGGAYWIWAMILFSFIIQAVSYEYRTKVGNFLGQKTFETFLLINGIMAPILIGVVVATFFTGNYFSVDAYNITNIDSPTIARWQNSSYGLESLLNITNIALGFTLLTLSRVLALLYFMNNIDNDTIIVRSKKCLQKNSILFLVFFLSFVFLILTADGFAVDPVSKMVSMEEYKYFNNLIEMPAVLITFLVGVVGVLYGIFLGAFKASPKGIWFAGPGTVLTVFAVFMLAGLNNTAFYPSTYDLQSSLTIANASSSEFTLMVMAWVSLLVPIVFSYIWYTWKQMSKAKISEEDLENDSMKY